jgi:hypothetical protein
MKDEHFISFTHRRRNKRIGEEEGRISIENRFALTGKCTRLSGRDQTTNGGRGGNA